MTGVTRSVGSGAGTPGMRVNTIVLVHGAFADGSGWRGVHDRLRQDGFEVVVVQNPVTSLEADVAATRRALRFVQGQAILVGHSYGGAVITAAGNDPEVAGLVYIAAFAPDAGESVGSLIANPVPGYDPPPFQPHEGGALTVDPARFPQAFAADVPADVAGFMAVSQVPWGDGAINGTIDDPAWRHKPTWYLIATEDRMIPPPAQTFMSGRTGGTVQEAAGSHAIYVSKPDVVAALIKQAAEAVRA